MRIHPSRVVLTLAALALAGIASAQSSTPKLRLSGYEAALKMMDQGECDQAKAALFPTGQMVAGDEVAISAIGDCYLKSADGKSDPEVAERTREIGAGWVLRAADIGVRSAQATAVRLYLDGKVFPTDPYEAGKWYLLWKSNLSQMQLGQVDFDVDLQQKLNLYGQDVWAEAKARAAKWRPVILRVQASPDAP